MSKKDTFKIPNFQKSILKIPSILKDTKYQTLYMSQCHILQQSILFEIGLSKIILLQNTQKEAELVLGRISATLGSLESHNSEKAAISSTMQEELFQQVLSEQW